MTILKLWFAGLLNYVWNNIVTHVPWHGFRLFFLRVFNRKISGSAVILLHTRILNFWKVQIGERVVVNQYVLLDCRRYVVRIENDADIGPYTRIWTLGHDPDSPTHETVGGDVVISHHAWIASGVTILPGVTVGEGAVIGASSLVHKPVPALEMWGGIPARFIRKRKNELNYNLRYTPYFD
jgi:putative colanic acid biosynthesis acetyltransferase WcaF